MTKIGEEEEKTSFFSAVLSGFQGGDPMGVYEVRGGAMLRTRIEGIGESARITSGVLF